MIDKINLIEKIDESKIEPQDKPFYETVVKHYIKQAKEMGGIYGNGFVFQALEDFYEKYGNK